MAVDLDAIKARAERATPGEWHASRPTSVCAGSRVIAGAMPDYHGARNRKSEADHNAEFIAHARTDVPALVAEVERLEHAHWERGHLPGGKPLPEHAFAHLETARQAVEDSDVNQEIESLWLALECLGLGFDRLKVVR